MENKRISPPIPLQLRSRVGVYAEYIRSRFILEKYGNPQFPGLVSTDRVKRACGVPYPKAILVFSAIFSDIW